MNAKWQQIELYETKNGTFLHAHTQTFVHISIIKLYSFQFDPIQIVIALILSIFFVHFTMVIIVGL